MRNQKLNSILLEIVRRKRLDVVKKRTNSSFKKIFSKNKKIVLIAEVKLSSPTNDDLGSREDLLNRVQQYEQAGADAVSIITEKYFFKGDLTFISQVKQQVNIPVLQKDFVIDSYQIYEAKLIGSDAILLIARLVDKKILKDFVAIAHEIGIEPIVEINNEEDLKKALDSAASFIAVNARDLRTFNIDIDKACAMLKKIPEKFIKLGFSGIQTSQQVKKYKNAGARGVLIGTSLMKAANIKDFINDLRNI